MDDLEFDLAEVWSGWEAGGSENDDDGGDNEGAARAGAAGECWGPSEVRSAHLAATGFSFARHDGEGLGG